MVHNWRDGSTTRPAKAFDADTGEAVPFVFYWDEDMNHVGRFAATPHGSVSTDLTGRPVEVWEFRRLRVEWKDEADAPHVVAAS